MHCNAAIRIIYIGNLCVGAQRAWMHQAMKIHRNLDDSFGLLILLNMVL